MSYCLTTAMIHTQKKATSESGDSMAPFDTVCPFRHFHAWNLQNRNSSWQQSFGAAYDYHQQLLS